MVAALLDLYKCPGAGIKSADQMSGDLRGLHDVRDVDRGFFRRCEVTFRPQFFFIAEDLIDLRHG